MKKLDEAAIDKIFRMRMNPDTEWPQEALSEADKEDWWRPLIDMAVDWSDAPCDKLLEIQSAAGYMVLRRMVDYCTPREEE